MNKIIFFVSLTLLVSCSQEQESMSNALQTDDSTWDENGVGFAEFLGCTKGPDFARENLEEMSEAFSQLALSENLMWSGAYVPVNAPEEFPDGFFWENNWTSEAAAKAAWEEWSANEDAKNWSDKYSNVLVCDENQVFSYEGYFQTPESISLKNWDSFVAAEISCEYNEGKSFADLKENIQEFRVWLMENGTGDEFSFGAYIPVGEDSADFWWYNWQANFDEMEAGNANWQEKGNQMQAKFDETATCAEPTLYNGMEFYRASVAS